MRTKAVRKIISLALVGVLPALAVQAKPQQPPISDAKILARAAADKGQAFFESGNYDQALAAFREAEQHFSAPTIRLMIARTYDKRGELLQARDVYSSIVDERLAHYAPEVFFQAQTEAKTELESLTRRIPTVQFRIPSDSKDPLTQIVIKIDESPIDASQPIQCNPGIHNLVASAPGRNDVTQTFSLQEGAREEITVRFGHPSVVPPSPRRTPARVTSSPVGHVPLPPTRGYLGPAGVAFGVAGVAIGVGTATGAMTFSKARRLSEFCRQQQCFDNAGGGTYDSALTFGAVSTVSFVVGSVAAAAGVSLLFWPRQEDGDDVRIESRTVANAPIHDASPTRGYVGAAVTAFGVAGLALGVGAVTGALTLSEAGRLDDECRQRKCFDNAGGGTYDRVETLGAVSSISFVVGGVASAAGTALLLWPRQEKSFRASAFVGPGWVGLRGGF